MEIIPSVVPAALLAIPFLVTMGALHFILFRPLFDYLVEREQLSAQARAEAEDLNNSAEERLRSIEEQLAATRKEATEIRQAARGKALETENQILAVARQEADAEVSAAVQQIVAEKERASATLRGTAKVLSTDIAARVLGRQPA